MHRAICAADNDLGRECPEMALQSEFRWLEPFEESTAETMLLNRERVVLWLNRQAAATLGRPKQDVIGKRSGEVLAPKDDRLGDEYVARAIKGRQAVVEVFRRITFQDSTRWFQMRFVPVAPERTAGHGWCVLVHATEVTAQVQLAALNALLGLRNRQMRKLDTEDERFVRMLLRGSTIHSLCTALQMSVEQVTARLVALAGTPLG